MLTTTLPPGPTRRRARCTRLRWPRANSPSSARSRRARRARCQRRARRCIAATELTIRMAERWSSQVQAINSIVGSCGCVLALLNKMAFDAGLSSAPGFSPIQRAGAVVYHFSGFERGRKPPKRLCHRGSADTGLKLGANENSQRTAPAASKAKMSTFKVSLLTSDFF